ncbi:MAG: fused MFS/spermidine synthase [Lactobacillales bacterium]|jgi:predicted membrane-bound spermidine synthase|nr:fused MFS/spermidine synthase [Lactobacillales bacterium]
MSNRIRSILLFLIFINGYISLSFELIALRQLSGFVSSTAITASIVIGTFLAFMSIGYYAGSIVNLVQRRTRKLIFTGLYIISIAILMGCSYVFMDIFFRGVTLIGIKSTLMQTFAYALVFLSLPPFYFGLITSLISRYLHRHNRNYTGRILAIDTVGSVLGSLFTTLLLMPLIGVNHTIMLMIAVCFITAAIIIPSPKKLLPFVFIVLFAIFINSDALLKKEYKIVENNAVSTISVASMDNGNSKIMFINRGASSKYTQDDALLFNYLSFIEKSFIRTLPQDRARKILVLGAGGFTMGDKDTFHAYTFVDIDAALLPVSEKYFLQKKLSPNKKFIVQDAGQFLKETPEMYDLIVLDTYSNFDNIPDTLITREYLTRAKSKLALGGILLINVIASPNFADAFSRKFDNTVHDVFGHNVSRQIIGAYDAWNPTKKTNVIYSFYNIPNDGEIYTDNKNSVIYDK